MKVNTLAIEREDRTERVLAYDNDNTTLTLMKYKDGRMEHRRYEAKCR